MTVLDARCREVCGSAGVAGPPERFVAVALCMLTLYNVLRTGYTTYRERAGETEVSGPGP